MERLRKYYLGQPYHLAASPVYKTVLGCELRISKRKPRTLVVVEKAPMRPSDGLDPWTYRFSAAVQHWLVQWTVVRTSPKEKRGYSATNELSARPTPLPQEHTGRGQGVKYLVEWEMQSSFRKAIP